MIDGEMIAPRFVSWSSRGIGMNDDSVSAF